MNLTWLLLLEDGGDYTTYTLLGQLTSHEHREMAVWGKATGLLASLPKVCCVLSIQIAPKIAIFSSKLFQIIE